MADAPKNILKHLHDVISHGLQSFMPKHPATNLFKGLGNVLSHISDHTSQAEDKTKSGALSDFFHKVIEKLDRLVDKLDKLTPPQTIAGLSNKRDSQSTQQKDIAKKIDDLTSAPPRVTIDSESGFESTKEKYGETYDWDKQLNKNLNKAASSRLDEMMGGILNQHRYAPPEGGEVAAHDISKKGSFFDELLGHFGGGGGGAKPPAGGGAAGGAADGEAAATGGGAVGLGGLIEGAVPIALIAESIKLLIDNFKHIGEDLKGMGREASHAFQSDKIEDVGEHTINSAKHGVSAYLRSIGGPILGSLAAHTFENNPLIQIQEAGFKMLGFLRQFTDHLIKANLQFSEFSGAMAAVSAQVEIQDMFLSMQKGEARAGATSNLAAAQFRTEQNLAPFENAWSNIRSDVMTSFNDLFNDVFGSFISHVGDYLESMRQYMRKIAFWVDWDRKERESAEMMEAARNSGDILNERAQQMFNWVRGGRRGPPPSFRP